MALNEIQGGNEIQHSPNEIRGDNEIQGNNEIRDVMMNGGFTRNILSKPGVLAEN